MQNKKQAFTLVELIVVITILAILGTIAFLSFQGYSKSSRDSVRISDLSSMKKSLELYSIQTGKYPLPSNNTPMTYSGGTVWNQGTFGDNVLQKVQRINKLPVDPLNQVEYTYSVTDNEKEYQIAGILEGDSQASTITSTYAAGTVGATAYVTGQYNGLITKVSTGGTIYILAIPSIISRDTTETNISNLITSNELVFNGYANLPSSYVNTTFNVEGGFDNNQTQIEIYSGTELPDQNDLVTFISNLESAYSGTILADTNYIDNVIEANLSQNSNIINQLGSELLNNSVGTEITVQTLPIGCTTNPGYANATFTTGTPTLPGQAWQNTNNLNPCYYECTGGYTGNDCSTLPNPYASCVGANNPTPFAATSIYGSCDTEDIIVCSGSETGYTIAACNIGTNTAGTTSSSYGKYFQWGNIFAHGTTGGGWTTSTIVTSGVNASSNGPGNYYSGTNFIRSDGLTNKDWSTVQNDNLWGETDNSDLARQGPCETGYHVPAFTEWTGLITAGGWGSSGTNFSNDLKMPFAGLIQDIGNVGSGAGQYWSTTPSGTSSKALVFNSTLYTNQVKTRGLGLSVRCMKD